ncbi:MAG: hypothetical protein HND55_14480 [Pseudomonadota bacterium]|nr:MAG: hypothetical protein HND55_14480 [Pseudomonadota bacterium]
MPVHSRLFFCTLILAAMAALTPPAVHAGLSVEADVVVSDEAGGTLRLITSASHEPAGSNVITTGDFIGFRPNPEGLTIDGEVVRTRIRSAESIQSTFDGSLTITGPEGDESGTLLLQGVTIFRGGEGPQLSGVVVFNDETFDAAELPGFLAATLRRVFRLFHFA